MNKQPTSIRWKKSSRSNGQAACVEVAHLGDHVAMRDSKQGEPGPMLTVTASQWLSFVRGVQAPR